ncbi:MAG: integrase [Rhodobacterales bacterium]|nr:MAG: integrase [Rhodobacterales bacterium]
MSKLTKRRVDALKPQEREFFAWDTELKGFGLRVMPTGRKVYVVQYRAGRRSRRFKLGDANVLTPDEARRDAKQLLAGVSRGDDPAGERQSRRVAPTMSGLCDRVLEEYAPLHCKPTTVKDYHSIIRNHIKPRLGMILITEITRADIVAFHHALRDTPYVANRAVAMLSKMLNLAEDWGLRSMGSNPARRIKKFREEERKRYLSSEEQMRLGQVLADLEADGSESPHVIAAFRLLILTGCRLGEIRTLQWDFVTTHHLELPDSKTGRRRIPLPREAYDILQSLPRRAGNPYVILGEAEDGPIINLQKPWRRIRTLAGIADVRIHDLRHTYASVAVQSGIDPFLLKEIMGHKNLTTTLRYAHLADETVQRAASQVAARFASSLGAPGERAPLRVVR